MDRTEGLDLVVMVCHSIALFKEAEQWVIFFLFSFPFLFGISYPFWMNRIINVVYAIPIALVVYGRMEEKRGNNFYKQLLTLMGYLVGFYLIFIAISFFVSPRIFHAMSIIWREALSFYPGPLIFSTFKVLLFVLFIIAVWDILEARIRDIKELEESKVRNEIMVQSLLNMQKVNETLAVVRHDEIHHLRMISGLIDEDEKKAKEYALKLTKQLEHIPTMRFTENLLVNTILSVIASKSREKGVSFDAKARLPQDIMIDDRSEERRVGKECPRLCISRWSLHHYKQHLLLYFSFHSTPLLVIFNITYCIHHTYT